MEQAAEIFGDVAGKEAVALSELHEKPLLVGAGGVAVGAVAAGVGVFPRLRGDSAVVRLVERRSVPGGKHARKHCLGVLPRSQLRRHLRVHAVNGLEARRECGGSDGGRGSAFRAAVGNGGGEAVSGGDCFACG